MVVDVDVLDLNDNPPVFVNKPYSAIVSRQAAVNSKVIQVMAVDADKGANADIYYQLVRLVAIPGRVFLLKLSQCP